MFYEIVNGMGGIVPPVPPIQNRIEREEIVKNVSIHNIEA